jgi:hypothetical protein
MKKRKYEGWKVVQNTVLDYLGEDGVTTHTAYEIAKLHNLDVRSIRKSAKRLGVKIKPAPRGGRRRPLNQYTV